MLILYVGAGGVIGAMARYLVVVWLHGGLSASGFPYGTLAVNAVGCFLIGAVVGFAEAHKPLSPEMQAFLLAGVLGGFTTFSAFGIDTIRLFRDAAYLAGHGERGAAAGGWAGGGGGGAEGGAGAEGGVVEQRHVCPLGRRSP